MAELSIRISHVVWRDGRPRFSPGPRLRALGFKGEDLRHGPRGPWFTPAEALAWAQAREAEIAARVAAVDAAARAGKRKPPLPRQATGRGGGALTVGELFEKWFVSPRMRGETETAGRRRQRAASPRTRADYRKKADALAAFDPVIYASPADALAKRHVYDLYERLWSAKGLHMARGMIAVLSAAIGWGIRRGALKRETNPCAALGMETPEPRLRALTPQEVRHMIAAADAIGRPEIGDSVALGVWTGQRQTDRRALIDVGLVDGRRIFRQSKTGALVAIPEAPELTARLAAARQRRKGWKVRPLELVCNESARAPFGVDHYRHCYAAVRAAAVAGVKDAAGQWRVAPMPSLADGRDQDLRDTAVTWLARAGCTIPEIGAITGHSHETIHAILRHYLVEHPELAENAMQKLLAWYDGPAQQVR